MVKDQIARGKTKPMVQVHPVAFRVTADCPKFGKGNGFKIHRCSHLAGSIPASATYIERR